MVRAQDNLCILPTLPWTDVPINNVSLPSKSANILLVYPDFVTFDYIL